MAKSYKRKSEPLNRWIALILALIGIFMGTIFSSTLILNKPITREDAKELNYTYKEFIVSTGAKGSIAEIKLLFFDGSAQYIDGCCVKDELVEKLEKTATGTKFKLLVNPKNDYVVELVADGVALLEFDKTQKELERDGVGFFYLGVAMYALGIFFFVQANLDFRKKIKRKKGKYSNM